MTTFYFEMTDTFSGEANYCWVKRYKTDAKTQRGAVNKFAKHVGAGWTKTMDSGDFARYDNGGVCVFVEEFDSEHHTSKVEEF